jgi:single-stranded DNA-binding protein
MALDVAGFGFLVGDAVSGISKNGRPWVRLRAGFGKGEGVIWLSVACFGRAVETAAELKRGDRIYLEARDLRLDKWRGKDGVERSGLSATATLIERTHMIGRYRREHDYDHESDDSPQPAEESPPQASSVPF